MWRGNITRQQEFFTKLAEDKGFHPYVEMHKWQDVTLRDIAKYKVGYIIISGCTKPIFFVEFLHIYFQIVQISKKRFSLHSN